MCADVCNFDFPPFKLNGLEGLVKCVRYVCNVEKFVDIQVDEIDNVYDEVDEEEYSKVVRKRQLQDDWIVDDGMQDCGIQIYNNDYSETYLT